MTDNLLSRLQRRREVRHPFTDLIAAVNSAAYGGIPALSSRSATRRPAGSEQQIRHTLDHPVISRTLVHVRLSISVGSCTARRSEATELDNKVESAVRALIRASFSD